MMLPQIRGYFLNGGYTMASKAIRESGVRQVSESGVKPNSRVTKKHIQVLLDAMVFATNPETDAHQKLGYLSFAVAGVLMEVGYPQHYENISKRMFDNYGKRSE